MPEAFLRLLGVTKRFGRRTVVDSLSLDIAEGETVALLGANGCGKTTTLRLMRIDRFARSYPSELSGGKQQRAAIARAIIAHPSLLLLDEPMSSLDAELKNDLMDARLWLKSSTTARLRPAERWQLMVLGCKTLHHLFVPVHPCADHVINDRHALLDAQWRRQNGVPPVCVFQPVRCRSAAQQARADLWP